MQENKPFKLRDLTKNGAFHTCIGGHETVFLEKGNIVHCAICKNHFFFMGPIRKTLYSEPVYVEYPVNITKKV